MLFGQNLFGYPSGLLRVALIRDVVALEDAPSTVVLLGNSVELSFRGSSGECTSVAMPLTSVSPRAVAGIPAIRAQLEPANLSVKQIDLCLIMNVTNWDTDDSVFLGKITYTC